MRPVKRCEASRVAGEDFVGRILQRHTLQPDGTMTRSFVENMRQVKSGLMRGTDKGRRRPDRRPHPPCWTGRPPRASENPTEKYARVKKHR